jgi:ribonucleoside-diphosphate reductase alpha chain
MLGMRYGSKESIELSEDIGYAMAMATHEAGWELAKELGPCELLESQENREKFVESLYFTEILREEAIKRSELYRYEEMIDSILRYGSRFTNGLSVAPTGTMSIVSNYMSSGIEPVFDFNGTRNVEIPNSPIKKAFTYYDYALLDYATDSLIEKQPDRAEFSQEEIEQEADHLLKIESLPDFFVSTKDLNVDDHLNILGAISKFIDQGISKTVVLPEDYSFEDYKDLWKKAYDLKIKGITVYRPNPEKITAVLVDKTAQEKIIYEVVGKNGEKITLVGTSNVVFKGEEYSALNLFDAFKDGRIS